MVPNGIDVAAIEALPAHADAADLIFVGRLIPHKHPEVFLQAAAWLSQRWREQGRPPPRLKVVGGGPLGDSLRAEVGRLGLAAQIVAWGEMPRHQDVVAHIKSSRLLVLPSTREGFGLVLVEAMAGGVPVLAARVPAVADTLGPTLADALFEPGDVEGLGRAMAAVLEDPVLHASRVQAGAARVRSAFGVRPFAERVLAVYERLRASAAR
jgi:glycosyltransferase involved in cell wall biosynthesis